MQAFLEFFVGLMAVLIAAVLSQLGLNAEPRREQPREVHRTSDCREPAAIAISTTNRDC